MSEAAAEIAVDKLEEEGSRQESLSLRSAPSAAHSKKEAQNPAIFDDDDDPKYFVDWEEGDKDNLRNMSLTHKYMFVGVISFATMHLTALSSVWSVTKADVVDKFHCSDEVFVLGITLYVLFLGLAPVVISPLSEAYGRRPIYAIAYICYFASQCITAFGPNIEAMLIGRAFCGLFGSTFMAVAPGTIADIFEPTQLTYPVVTLTIFPFTGPSVGPLIGGFVENAKGFRWVYYVFLIWSAAAMVLLLMIPETYPPKILTAKAKKLRKETGDNRYYSPAERLAKERGSVTDDLVHHLKLPFLLLANEPMLVLLCVYTGITLSIVYLFFVAFPIVFEGVYGFGIQYVGMSFMGILVGMVFGALMTPIWQKKRRADIAANNGVMEPEMLLPMLCVGSVAMPIGLFMFAWTIYPSVHWIVPQIASAIFGYGTYCTFNGILQYTVATYKECAASATGCNIFIRCTMASIFPLFAAQMYHNLDYHWATSLLGFLTVAFAPSAIVFLKYGKQLREKSKYAIKTRSQFEK